MFDEELNNFLSKFQQLRRAGLTAHLDLDTCAGKSWIGLRVMLGKEQHQNGKRRSSSYYRRQERRKAARAAEQSTLNGNVTAAEASNNANDSTAAEASNSKVQNKDVHVEEKNAEKATSDFNCELCEFKSTRESGLSVHMTQKHPKLEQLDGGTIDPVQIERDEEFAAQFEECEEDIDHYLQTGELRDSGDFVWEYLTFVIEKAGDPGQELLVALDARKRAIEENQPGTYKQRVP